MQGFIPGSIAESNDYFTDEMPDEELNDGDWDVNDADSAPGGVDAVRACDKNCESAKRAAQSQTTCAKH